MEPLIKCEHVDLGYENQDAVINVNMEVLLKLCLLCSFPPV